jgi:hypothetical protein
MLCDQSPEGSLAAGRAKAAQQHSASQLGQLLAVVQCTCRGQQPVLGMAG